MNGEEKYDFDTVKFNGDIEERYPGVTAEVRDGLYDIRWENYSGKYQFELSMHYSASLVLIGDVSVNDIKKRLE